MSEIIALSAVGLGFMLLVGIAFAFGVYLVVSRLFRKPAPPPQSLNPEDRNLDFLRRQFPDPTAQPQKSFLDGMVAYGAERRAQIDRAKYQEALDKMVGINATAPPNA